MAKHFSVKLVRTSCLRRRFFNSPAVAAILYNQIMQLTSKAHTTKNVSIESKIKFKDILVNESIDIFFLVIKSIVTRRSRFRENPIFTTKYIHTLTYMHI